MHTQIPLDFVKKPSFGRSLFVRGESNSQVWTAIESWRNWQTSILTIYGSKGTGKTHLAHIWCERTKAIYLDGEDTHHITPIWQNNAICLDNAAQAPEIILFSLINMALNGDIPALLMCAQDKPAFWPIELSDLQSRLRSLPHVEILPHGDQMIGPILRKLFADRDRIIQTDMLDYIIPRIDRSPSGLIDFVEAIDLYARRKKIDLTRGHTIRFFQETAAN